MIKYETLQAIRALPGKTVQPWKDGDPRCHCTHCSLCGALYRTEDIGKHIDECQAALIKALKSEMENPVTEQLREDHIARALEEVDKEHRHTKLSCGFDGSEVATLDAVHDIARDYVAKFANNLIHQLETDGLAPEDERDRVPTIVPPKPSKRRFASMRAIQREVGKWADEVDGVTSDLHTTAAQTRTRFAAKLEDGILRIDALLKKMCEARGRI